MKIAYIVRSFPKISETFLLNQIIALIASGHEVDIFAFNKVEDMWVNPDILKNKLMDKVFYTRAPENKKERINKAFKIILKQICRKPKFVMDSLNIFRYKKKALSLRRVFQIYPFLDGDYDIIHCCFGPTGIFGVILRDIGVVNSKIITSFHGYDISRYLTLYGKNAYENLFSKGDIFLPVCDHFKKKLIELGCEEKKIVVHRMGLDINKFKAGKIKKDSSMTKILSIGRLIEKKGISYGILAVSRLIKKFKNLEYNIIGDGPLRNDLEDLIQELNISEYVNILGLKNNDETIKLIRESDIFIAPSVEAEYGNIEGIPNVLKEAMAIGVPVISTYHSGIPELVIDGITGYLIPERDVDALEEKIADLIKNPETAREVVINAREHIIKYYDIRKLTRDLERTYEKLLDSKNC